jgi:2-oxoglutarate ferredoxin oxidoreductase subunit gamma
MHDEYWEPVERRLRPGGLAFVNSSTFAREVCADVTVHRLPATELAADAGSPLGGSLAMIGAYAAVTGMVTLDSLVEGMRQSIPSYRRQHVEANERALRAGHDHLPHGSSPAWPTAGVRA